MIKKTVINELLQCFIVDNVLNKETIFSIVEQAKEKKCSFITYFIEQKKLDSTYLARLLASEFFLPFLDLDAIDASQLPLHLVDKELLSQHQVLPLWINNQTLGLATADPSQQAAIEDIRFHTGLRIECTVVEPNKLSQLLKNIAAQFLPERKILGTATPLKSSQEQESLDISSTALNRSALDTETAIIHYVDKLLACAVVRDASDIHVESYPDHLAIRFRIDGLLYAMASLSQHFMQRIITRLKIMSQLDIAERRIPQDGRFQIKDSTGRAIGCRISTCPTVHGEKLVIRILDSNRKLLDIGELGMSLAQKVVFLRALNRPHGMILVTGPTGSGKTITLYTALSFLNISTVNISSVEDPIELILPGINQVNVNPKIGLDFSTVLRAFLRQDPDIVMVGEMRDQETAEIGIKAAQTGHLVLSTLHTNSAAESLIRLANMGVPAYNIVSSVQLIIAQRLVRRLCDNCKVAEHLPKKILLGLGLDSNKADSARFFTAGAGGCTKCIDGYRGRTGIFEILSVTDRLRKLILQEDDAMEISLQAQKEGMQTLYLSALDKLEQGKISLLEMKRVIKD